MIRKAVITAAGKGSRMQYITSVLPKALLPLFRRENGRRVMRPIIDLIMSSLSAVGVESFAVVIGKQGKLLVDYLEGREVTFVVQEQPKGFGDAVLRAESFIHNEPFFVHADDGVLTGGYLEASELYKQNEPEAVLLLRKVDNPFRYGIVKAEEKGEFLNHKLYRVLDAQEKPKNPFSNLAISAVYIFKPSIFKALKEVTDYEGELELTYGIKRLLDQGGEVYAILLEKERWLNVGDPEHYYEALEYSYHKT